MENFEKLTEKLDRSVTKAAGLVGKVRALVAAKEAALQKVEDLETEKELCLEQIEDLSGHLETLDSLFNSLEPAEVETPPIFTPEEIEGLEDGGATGPAWMRREAEAKEEARPEDSIFFANLTEAEREERSARGLPTSTAEAEALGAFEKELEEVPAEELEAAPSISSGLN